MIEARPDPRSSSEALALDPRSSSAAIAPDPRSNNFDWVRLLAAIAVLWGHSFALAMRGAHQIADPVSALFPGTYSARLAVAAFFLVSGFLITGALLRDQNWRRFLRRRLARIMPAYVVMLFLTGAVLGCYVTNNSAASYFADPRTWQYLLANLSFYDPYWELPGVFVGHQNIAMNGSLWSLFVEVRLYLLSGLLIIVGGYQNRRWLAQAALLVGMLIASMQGAFSDAQSIAYRDRVIWSCIFLYGLGAFVRFHFDRPSPKLLYVLIALALALLLKNTVWRQLAYCLALSLSVFWLTFTVAKLPALPGDYSFGLFLWHFPVQQALAWQWPSLDPYQMAACSLLVTAVIAWLSWHWVEKPMLRAT